jgi:hypothetical protein
MMNGETQLPVWDKLVDLRHFTAYLVSCLGPEVSVVLSSPT